jgi:opacity protein-like surface antigen
MKRITISLISFALLSVVANAGGKIEPKDPVDTFSMADSNNTNSKDRSLYMPEIITPDSLKSGLYGGLGLSISSLANDTSTALFSQKAGNNRMIDLSVIAGYNFNKYIATESRFVVSAAYDNDVDFTSWGLYLKPQYEVYKDLSVYSLIGFGKLSAKNISDDKLKVSKTTTQFGIGANYKLINNFKVFADYTYLGKDSNAKFNNGKSIMKASAVTTGITYDF